MGQSRKRRSIITVKNMKKAVLLWAAAALFTWGMLVITEDGFARAGRGQSYRSRSSSSSSSRSYKSSSSYRSSSSRSYSSSDRYRSSGSSYGRYFSDTSKNEKESSTNWGLVILVLAGFIIGGYYLKRYLERKGLLNGETLVQQPEPLVPFPVEEAIAKIRETDPDFSLETFLSRAGEIFRRLQAAWSDGDMAPVRNYLSQGVYNRYRIQLEIMRDIEGVKNLMSDVNISWSGLAGLNDGGAYQTLHVMISASARDITLPVTAGVEEVKRALGSASLSHFSEVYSFTRKRGVRTDAGKDWLKGQCPNCGFVPDNFSQVNKCPSCGSIYNSGEYDWVLSEITQREEWNSDSSSGVPGLEELAAVNLAMNRQVVEDRASYLFWRWIQARVRGSGAPLGRDASKNFLDEQAPKTKEYLAETAVGSVDLGKIWLEDQLARAEVLVLWSASEGRGREPLHREHALMLSMPAGMENKFGLGDHGCVNCGAPLPESDAVNCAYCGAALPTVNDDWLLDELEERG